MRIAVELSLILVLLGVNAVLAASEAAAISLRETTLRETTVRVLDDGGNRAAGRGLRWRRRLRWRSDRGSSGGGRAPLPPGGGSDRRRAGP